MTVLENAIRIDATPEKVWSVLAALEALAKYDPGVSKSELVSTAKEGPGAARKCELVPGGWFKERVVDWQPNEALSFELYECTLPVHRVLSDGLPDNELVIFGNSSHLTILEKEGDAYLDVIAGFLRRVDGRARSG